MCLVLSTDFQESLEQIQRFADKLRRAGDPPAAVMIEVAIWKLRNGAFCAESISTVPRGGVEDRAHAECCVYFLKAALDCIAESINLRFKLRLTKPDREPYLAASMEILERERTKRTTDVQSIKRTGLARAVESIFESVWYKDLKWLRDVATHHGLLRHGFNLGGPTYLKGRDGRDRELPVREDLRHLLEETTAALISVAELLV